jgi:hypothetical protein
MTAASRSLATAPSGARFATGLLSKCYTTGGDRTCRPATINVRTGQYGHMKSGMRLSCRDSLHSLSENNQRRGRALTRKMSRVFRRIRESGLRKVPVIVYDSIRRAIGKKVTVEHIVYRLDGAAYAVGAQVLQPAGFTVERFECMGDVPAAIWSSLPVDEVASVRKDFDREFDNAGVLWIGYMSGQFAASAWSVRAELLEKWFVDLQKNDLVIYATVTLNAFRGRGIHPAIFRQIIDREGTGGFDIYCDAAKWNVVAQRNIEKAGFRSIGVMPELS